MARWRFALMAALLAVVAVAAAPQASAQNLLGTLNTGTDETPATSTLVEIDPATGNLLRTIGDVGYAVNGLTYDFGSGTLWATTSSWDPAFPDGLITINLATGAGTPVGSGAGQYVNVPASNSAGQVYGWTEETDDPVLWNTAAGTITVLGASGIDTRAEGLAFDNTDTLYLVNDYDWNDDGQSVYTINTGTGVATAVGALPSLPYGHAHHGDFHPTTNLYYGIDALLGRDGVVARNLLVINISTLTVVDTIPTVDYLQAVTFGPQVQAAGVPALGPAGIAFLALLLATVAVIIIRRRLA